MQETQGLLAKPNVYADLSMMDLLVKPAVLAGVLRPWLDEWPEKVLYGSDPFDGGPGQGWEQAAWIASSNARRAECHAHSNAAGRRGGPPACGAAGADGSPGERAGGVPATPLMPVHCPPSLRALVLRLALVLPLASCGSGASDSAPTAPAPPTAPTTSVPLPNEEVRPFDQYTELVWHDEFDGTSLDSTNWTPEVRDVWFNNELEATTTAPANLRVADGTLALTAVQEAYHDRGYTSARITGKGKQEFLFGRLDVRAKLPKGKGIWPAIWMLGADEDAVGWPACGEIDIMELQGSVPNVVHATLHTVSTVATGQNTSLPYTLPSGDFSDAFHVFSIVRGRDQMAFYVDGQRFATQTVSSFPAPYPFNGPFHVILDLAVGGDYDGVPDGSTRFPQAMQVDYVRFWHYPQ